MKKEKINNIIGVILVVFCCIAFSISVIEIVNLIIEARHPDNLNPNEEPQFRVVSESELRLLGENESYEKVFEHSKDGFFYIYHESRNGTTSKYKKTCWHVEGYPKEDYYMLCNITEIKE